MIQESPAKVAFISDLHLGSDKCKLNLTDGTTPAYESFRSAIEHTTNHQALDFLILIGDILDFAIKSFEQSCRQARSFFQQIQSDNLARKIIYVPGNHDKHVWDAVEWETRIIGKLKKYENPVAFRRTQPGLLDLTQDGDALHLPRVSKVQGTEDYGNIFIEGVFKDQANRLPVAVVYPNLYVKTDADGYLVTHGHMLDLAWMLLLELLQGTNPDGIKFKGYDEIGIEEFEAYNYPLTALICTGIGQAGELTELLNRVQNEAKAGEANTLEQAFDQVNPRIDALIHLGLFEFADNVILSQIKKQARKIAKNHIRNPRYDQNFLKKESVRQRFARFYRASCRQAEEEFDLPPLSKIIFGHTHEPIPANKPWVITDKNLPDLGTGTLAAYNTGGWLKDENKSAEIFFLGGQGNLESQNIE